MPGNMRSFRGKARVDTCRDSALCLSSGSDTCRDSALCLSSRCPDKSILLAYTRNQKIENPLAIRMHIEHCQFCRQQCDEYERLDVLVPMQNSLSYSEPLAYEVLDVIRGGERRRRAKPGSAVPSLSIRRATAPLILLLVLGALMVVTAVAALAFMHTGNTGPGGNAHQVQIVSHSSTPVISHHDPTPAPKSTAAVPISTLSPTPGTNSRTVSTPNIAFCSSPEDQAHSILRICGQHFTPGHHVALLVKMPGASKPKQLATVLVDAQGNFEDSFIINNCKVPLAISALDLTSPVSTNVLQNISFANCPASPQ